MTNNPKPEHLPSAWIACVQIEDPHATHATYVVVRETPDRMMDRYFVQMAIYRHENNPPDWEYFQAEYTNDRDEALYKMARRSPIRARLAT